MPHIILSGPVNAEDIHLAFQPIELKEGTLIGKANECFINQEKEVVLIRSVVIEKGYALHFFMKISAIDEEITLQLETLGAPERTEGVRRFLGYCAWVMMQSEPELKIESGNLHDYIKAPE